MKVKQSKITRKIFNGHVIKACLYVTNLAAITMYIFVRLLFHDYNISFKEDMINFGKTILIAVVLGCVLFTIYTAIELLYKAFAKKTRPTAVERKLPGEAYYNNIRIAS